MKRQTLVQAVHLATSGKSKSLAIAANSMSGCPVGGWPETDQAYRQLRDELPLRSERSYTIDHFISAMCAVDFAGRYARRDDAEALREAAKIEGGLAK